MAAPILPTIVPGPKPEVKCNHIAALATITNKSLTNKCIVLDVDECMIKCDEEIDNYNNLGIATNPALIEIRQRCLNLQLDDVMGKKGSGINHNMWGIMRPYLPAFLRFCFIYFKVVAIWSAGTKRYVESVANWISRDCHIPHVIFTRNNCVVQMYRGEKLHKKPLAEMISQVPKLEQYMRMDNAVLVDDRNVSFIDNPDNGIQIPRYDPAPTVESLSAVDDSLLKLMYWFMLPEVRNAPDIRKLDKSKIFTTPLEVYQKTSVLPPGVV